MCRYSCNLGASTSWNPQDLSRPVLGLLYLSFYLSKQTLLRVGGSTRKGEGSAWQMDVDWPTEQLSCVWRVFWPVSFDPEAIRYRPDLEIWQCVIKGRQEKVIHANYSQVSGHLRGCKTCVWYVAWDVKRSRSNKGTVSATWTWPTLPFVPPPPRIFPCD
jgi:hypothetical protein